MASKAYLTSTQPPLRLIFPGWSGLQLNNVNVWWHKGISVCPAASSSPATVPWHESPQLWSRTLTATDTSATSAFVIVQSFDAEQFNWSWSSLPIRILKYCMVLIWDKGLWSKRLSLLENRFHQILKVRWSSPIWMSMQEEGVQWATKKREKSSKKKNFISCYLRALSTSCIQSLLKNFKLCLYYISILLAGVWFMMNKGLDHKLFRPSHSCNVDAFVQVSNNRRQPLTNWRLEAYMLGIKSQDNYYLLGSWMTSVGRNEIRISTNPMHVVNVTHIAWFTGYEEPMPRTYEKRFSTTNFGLESTISIGEKVAAAHAMDAAKELQMNVNEDSAKLAMKL